MMLAAKLLADRFASMTTHDRLQRARKRVDDITGFYVHFVAFAFVIAGLVALNIAYDPEWWVQWPLVGWGAGILAYAAAVFGQTPQFITEWRLRKIRELSGKM